ncbi:LysR family transcriptional regulator [Pseudonocardia humida]|uniref:LysR family transcriptional regulator n=1 Tax=Pseudonocardia humida TaxID=2800819 RepID=A0ABT1ACX7_9PSEU|nr:LysR substrate-binding domain-containing protein [Pseudonocardia humida]MCO1660917.1 LysR family transcriptional regulator [Pseudonocardia humida]
MDAGPYADPDDLGTLSVAQLRAVCAVADRLSFTAAAADLGLTQPAVSRLVTGAERRLGLFLFHRAHRSVAPRADTAAVLQAIRSALAAHQTVLHQARAVRRGESGVLRVGVLRGGSPAVLTDTLIRFRVRWPEVRLNLAEYRDDQLIEAVRDGQVDVALARLATTIPSTLSRRRMLREQLHALVPTGHPLAARGEITMSDLATEAVAFWSSDAQPRGRAWLAHALVTAGHSGELVDVTPSTVAATVAAGAAVTVLAPSFSRILDLRGIALVPVAELFLELVVVWRRDDPSPALHRFLASADHAASAGPGQARPAGSVSGRVAEADRYL